MEDFCGSKFESLERSFGTVPYKHLENERQSLATGEKLRQSFIARGNPNPAAYGSRYLDEEGILVINVVDDDAQLKKEIAEALGNAKYYTRRVDHSLAYLEKTRDVITKYMMQRPKGSMLDNFVLVAADEKHNTVVIELKDPTEEAVKAFKKNVIDSPALSFKKTQGVPTPYADINPGSEIRYYAYPYAPSYDSGSVGYRVSNPPYTSQGIITAGHLFSSTGMYAYVGTTQAGGCSYCSLNEPTDCDAAMLTIFSFSGYTPVNALPSGYPNSSSINTSLVSSFYVDQIVYKYGQGTGWTAGYLVDFINVYLDIAPGLTVLVQDVLRASTKSSAIMAGPGDSGCFLADLTTSNTCGICLGGPLPYANPEGWFSKATNIYARFGCSRY